ncbi:DUF6498-containing protein [Natrarchaeobaculum aegyptiacum]|uniref:Uncharacterized protein n=1 Tax=Natrarchaeobaculum aegyptiacum TaxID=745377 RepID=A0A2Z2HXJ7_9EURY|nr:DUF6498-containing protein [Natrarchaeobaculum aegyptiacum]ARS91852.1 hypothetical protein B1756_13450 [Natrarchaeobaculum aegyptiacum]
MYSKVEKALFGRFGLASDYLTQIITHAFLVVGIVAFQWSVFEILLIYVLEIAVINVLFTFAALFAAQPIDGRDAEKWKREPNPIRTIPLLPPVYRRNVGVVVKQFLASLFYLSIIGIAVVDFIEQSVLSLLSSSAGLAVLAICITQTARVWQQFFAGQSYRERSPAEAIKAAQKPLGEALFLLLLVIVPITVALGITAIAVAGDGGEIELGAVETGAVLLLYVIPIGVVRVWLQDAKLTIID